MGGLPCAKAVIDNGRGAVQNVTSQLAVIERAIGCMTNSVLLGAAVGKFPTEEMEDQFIKAGTEFKNALQIVGSNYLRDVGNIAAYYDSTVTDNPILNNKPRGNGK